MKIYEVRNTSNDEFYVPIGLFGHFDNALKYVNENDPTDWPECDEDEYASAEIWERDLDKPTGRGNCIYTVEYEYKWEDEIDDGCWLITSQGEYKHNPKIGLAQSGYIING